MQMERVGVKNDNREGRRYDYFIKKKDLSSLLYHLIGEKFGCWAWAPRMAGHRG